MMRKTLAALYKACNLKTADEKQLLAAAKTVWGPTATLDTYRAFVRRWHALEPRGRSLAEFVVTYGLPPNLSRDDIDALDIAQPYAFALRVRLAADAQVMGNGGVGDDNYYATLTGGDMKEAKRLRAEAIARKAL